MLPPLAPAGPALRQAAVRQLDGFTLHAATHAGALDPVGREALCKYVLRPAIAQERITHGPDGLVRIALKRPFSDGTVAVDLDPLSLLCAPGGLGATARSSTPSATRGSWPLPASCARASSPSPSPRPPTTRPSLSPPPKRCGSHYRPWAELLKRTFDIDVRCPRCEGRMKLVAIVTDPRLHQARAPPPRRAHRPARARACTRAAVLEEPGAAALGERRGLRRVGSRAAEGSREAGGAAVCAQARGSAHG